MAGHGPTLHDVAERAGVSIATVSRIARGIGDAAPATRERVLAVIADMGYRPNHHGRALVQRRHETLGIVFPGLRGPYYSEVIHGFELEAVAASMSVLILGTERIPHATEKAVSMADRADGIAIMGGSTVDDREVERMAVRGVSVILLAREPLASCPAIRVDNLSATRDLTAHLLLDHGYRSLVFVGNIDGAPDATERWHGFLQAHWQAGIEPPTAPIPTGFDEYAGVEAGQAIFAQESWPQAIAAANDEIAFGIASVAAARGIRIPDDIALTGWDDIPLARLCNPPLTTVRQPMRDLGREAARTLLGLIAGQSPDVHDRVLPATVVRRVSCGCHDTGTSLPLTEGHPDTATSGLGGKGGGDGPATPRAP